MNEGSLGQEKMVKYEQSRDYRSIIFYLEFRSKKFRGRCIFCGAHTVQWLDVIEFCGWIY